MKTHFGQMRVGRANRTAGTNAAATGASRVKQYIMVEEPGVIVPLSTLQYFLQFLKDSLELGSLCINNVYFFKELFSSSWTQLDL